MRKTKFRAWHKINKEWLWPYPEGFNIIGEVTVFDMLKQRKVSDYINIEIVQFTGLLDKSGKEIYEGDIVKNDLSSKSLIVWVKDICAFYQAMIPYALSYSEYDGTTMKNLMPHMIDMRFNLKEIIGNKYENGVLLK